MSTTTTPSRAAVKRALPGGTKPTDVVSAAAATCAAGAQCTDVTSSAMGAAALAGLQKAVATAQTSLSAKQAALLALLAAIRALKLDMTMLMSALRSYESVVGTIAAGSAAIINKAGLLSRDAKPAAAALGTVSNVTSKPGKSLTEAIVSWPAAPGATAYAIQVNFTPATPAGPWTSLMQGTGRRRVVKAPTAGAQFLVQIAALSSDGTQSAWSNSILATAR
jgi:hypothetical protein